MSSFFSLVFLCLSLSLPLISGQPGPVTLNDHRIASGVPAQSLDGAMWRASSPSQSLSIPATVPGDIITDLFRAAVIPEPLYELNWKNASIWNDHDWTYSRGLPLTAEDLRQLRDTTSHYDVLLVFDGIKMGANISINGVRIDTSISQFTRSVYSLRALVSILQDTNTLSVLFSQSILTHGLFMQCTGGWDWAPYSDTKSPDGWATFSRGIWKSVYIVRVPGLAITSLVTQTHYTGAFPTTPLTNGAHAPFRLNVSVHVYTSAASSGVLEILGQWSSDPVGRLPLPAIPAGVSIWNVQATVTSSQINLWWPNNLGLSPLYTVTARLTETGVAVPVLDERRVGFRFFAIVTGNDTDPEWVRANAGVNGTDSMGLRFRVNGYPLFVRGANVIPMDNMEGRYSAEAHRQMVINAAEGRMNILRIWGGGIYQPEVFYDTADEFGVMVYHDLMNRDSYSGQMAEEDSYRHQVRRLSHHASIVIWDGCNECNANQGGIGTTVMGFVVDEDQSRPIWPSCPAGGWDSGVNRLSSIPNGAPLKPGSASIEGHGPYQHGDGFPAVNGDPNNLDLFASNIPLKISNTPTGLSLKNYFTSEFGSVGFSSFESMSPTVAPAHLSLHGGAPWDSCSGGGWPSECRGGNVMAERNYPCDNLIIVFFGGNQTDLNAVGEQAFKKQLWQCTMAQALVVKGYIEQHHNDNVYGLQIWQLNEIWPTGGWGSIEYGTPTFPGQVVGGRWKPLHHLLRQNLYGDYFITCGVASNNNNICFIKNQRYEPVEVSIIVYTMNLMNGTGTTLINNVRMSLPSGPGGNQYFALPAVDRTSVLVRAGMLRASDNVLLAENDILFAEPYKLQMATVTITATVAAQPNPDGSINVVLAKKEPAVGLFVTLTTLAPGRFSLNAFTMEGLTMTIQFIPFGELDAKTLTNSLRVEHANMYM